MFNHSFHCFNCKTKNRIIERNKDTMRIFNALTNLANRNKIPLNHHIPNNFYQFMQNLHCHIGLSCSYKLNKSLEEDTLFLINSIFNYIKENNNRNLKLQFVEIIRSYHYSKVRNYVLRELNFR